jgi:eukaryotic-like serine/threonine-protein kinase
VERWLADEPVSARREPMAERAGRWVRRHRPAAAATAAALVASVVGMSAVLVVQARANVALGKSLGRERNANDALVRANDDLKTANARVKERFALAMETIKLFHGEISEELLLKEPQFAGLQAKLLKGASDFYRRLQGVLKDQTDRDSRIALAGAFDELGNLIGKIGDTTTALAVHREALAIHQALAVDREADSGTTLYVARSLVEVGRWQGRTGHKASALESFEAARRLAEGVDTPGRTGEPAENVLGTAHHLSGWLFWEMGRTDDALASHGRARVIRKRLVEAHPRTAGLRYELAESDEEIGMILSRTGRIKEAMDSLGRALASLQELVKTGPENTSSRRHLAVTHNDLGRLMRAIGRPEEAMEQYTRALAIRRELAVANPTTTVFRRDVVHTELSIGYALAMCSDARLRSAIEIPMPTGQRPPSLRFATALSFAC